MRILTRALYIFAALGAIRVITIEPRGTWWIPTFGLAAAIIISGLIELHRLTTDSWQQVQAQHIKQIEEGQ